MRKTGKMMNSVVVKRKSTKIGTNGSNMEMTIGFRNSKYDKRAEIHSAGQGNYPQARDIWRAVYNKHRSAVVHIMRHGTAK